jgi:alkylation response protein AidB-like acyl-CoA dehydrogenase
VDFELSDDQRALQEAARDLLDGYASPTQVRAHLTSDQPYDAKLWTAMVEQGWMGITLAEAKGGLGLGWVEAAVLLEEVGRHVAPAPFLSSLLALEALAAAGEDDWVQRLVSGAAVGCAAWTTNAPVIGASAADVAVIAGPTALQLVELDEGAGGRPGAEPAMDGTRTLAWLKDRPARQIGGADAAQALLDRAAVGFSAEMLGGAARILEMAAEYAKDRIQFGQPIGSFQAVKHRCADMVVDVEGMRSATWYAAWCLAAGDPDASVAASAAKIWCSDAARRVMASGLQIHGGIGFTWEHDLHLYLKRSQLDQLSFGDASFHRDRLAGLLRAKVEAGESVI